MVLFAPGVVAFKSSPLQCFRPLPAWSGSAFGSAVQNTPTSSLQRGNIMKQCVPHRGDIYRTISMDIKVPRVFDDPPRDSPVLSLNVIRKLCCQFSDLHNAHTTGILKHIVGFKSSKIVLVSRQIIGNSLAVGINLLKNNPVTSFDRAAPRLSRLCSKNPGRMIRWSPSQRGVSRHPQRPGEIHTVQKEI